MAPPLEAPLAGGGLEKGPVDWAALLAPLASGPRENGSSELLATAQWLANQLRGLDWEVWQHWYTAYPLEQRVLGLVLFAGGIAYAACMWRRRFGWAALLALLLPLLVATSVDLGVPLSWFAPFSQPNVVAWLPNPQAQEALIFSAHFDTKTDLLDHTARAPILMFAAPMAILMCAVASGSLVAYRAGSFSPGRQAMARIFAWAGALYAVALAAVLSGGMLLEERSPGALDDGAACALLLRLAQELRVAPPRNLEIYLVFFSGEELATQGSQALLRHWRPGQAPRPVTVVNLDPVGASDELRVLAKERRFLTSSEPSAEALALVDEAHREFRGKPMESVELVGLTDGWAWQRYGYPALTLFSFVPPFGLPRGLHSKEDHRARVDNDALEASLALLQTIVRVRERKLLASPPQSRVDAVGIPIATQGGKRNGEHTQPETKMESGVHLCLHCLATWGRRTVCPPGSLVDSFLQGAL